MADGKQSIFSSLDNAKTQLYHYKAIVIAGMGFFTDAYDLFCITAVTKLIGRLYYYDPSTNSPAISNSDDKATEATNVDNGKDKVAEAEMQMV
ncbi:hypothetical protein GBA52_006715 [Prunus armeniaca]|nr:hypothetical protein GBA52_006488 [Prunus armeniaca]KAH0979538.1 hypothetical protein GBA52_006715 [Prunus armeniaca]